MVVAAKTPIGPRHRPPRDAGGGVSRPPAAALPDGYRVLLTAPNVRVLVKIYPVVQVVARYRGAFAPERAGRDAREHADGLSRLRILGAPPPEPRRRGLRGPVPGKSLAHGAPQPRVYGPEKEGGSA